MNRRRLKKAERRIRDKYLTIKPLFGQHRCELSVDFQYFTLTDGDKEHCEFIADMAAIALAKIVANENHNRP